MIRPVAADDVNALAEAMRASYAEEPWHEQWTQRRATRRMKRFIKGQGLSETAPRCCTSGLNHELWNAFPSGRACGIIRYMKQ